MKGTLYSTVIWMERSGGNRRTNRAGVRSLRGRKTGQQFFCGSTSAVAPGAVSASVGRVAREASRLEGTVAAPPSDGRALSQWTELNVFCSDGAVPIDNNISEREMKRVVLNRKNSLFVGNPRAGRTAAILASLTWTCRRHDIDPQLYLTQLLVNLPSARTSELPAWLADQWKLAQASRTLNL